MTAAEAIAGAVLAGLIVLIAVEEAEIQGQDSLTRCVAASPARTDTEVEAMEAACAKLLSHREMLGR